jgi:hypothetical protein
VAVSLNLETMQAEVWLGFNFGNSGTAGGGLGRQPVARVTGWREVIRKTSLRKLVAGCGLGLCLLGQLQLGDVAGNRAEGAGHGSGVCRVEEMRRVSRAAKDVCLA